MSVDFTPEQQQIRDSVTRLCAEFGDQYWLARDSDGRFPEEFCKAIAEHGCMGIATPVEYGGAGLGITEAALLMQAISQSGAGNGGVSSISIGIFGLNPVLRFGTEEQKRRMLPPVIKREHIACFGVTEPNTGLDPTRLTTRAVRRGVRYVGHGQKTWISTAQVANKILLIARTTEEGGAARPIDGRSLFYADHPAPDPLLHRRAGAGLAEIVLNLSSCRGGCVRDKSFGTLRAIAVGAVRRAGRVA